MTHFNIYQIAGMLRSKTIGWISYYGKFRKSEMRGMIRVLNFRSGLWVRNKYCRFRKKPWYCAYKWLVEVSKDFPGLFVHRVHGFLSSIFFKKSRINREVHVRFCERFGGETPPYLLDPFNAFVYSLKCCISIILI
jgi:hypothetical protein